MVTPAADGHVVASVCFFVLDFFFVEYSVLFFFFNKKEQSIFQLVNKNIIIVHIRTPQT